MTKTVVKIGSSQGIILDAALMELAHLKVGDQVDVTVHAGGTIILTRFECLLDRLKLRPPRSD